MTASPGRRGPDREPRCGLRAADSLSTPGHFRPSLVTLVKNEALCIMCSRPVPSLPLCLAPALSPTPSGRWTRFPYWPLVGGPGSLGSSPGRHFCPRCTQLVRLCSDPGGLPPWACAESLLQARGKLAGAVLTVQALVPHVPGEDS